MGKEDVFCIYRPMLKAPRPGYWAEIACKGEFASFESNLPFMGNGNVHALAFFAQKCRRIFIS